MRFDRQGRQILTHPDGRIRFDRDGRIIVPTDLDRSNAPVAASDATASRSAAPPTNGKAMTTAEAATLLKIRTEDASALLMDQGCARHAAWDRRGVEEIAARLPELVRLGVVKRETNP
jgi:hypothetical protein